MELEAHKIQSPPVGHSDRFRFGAVLLQVLVHDGLVPGVGFEEDLPAALVHFQLMLHRQRVMKGVQIAQLFALDGVLGRDVFHPEHLPVLLHFQAEVVPQIEVDGLHGGVDGLLVGSEDHDVVHVPRHVGDVQLLHDEMVERLQ